MNVVVYVTERYMQKYVSLKDTGMGGDKAEAC